jgi:hypothetical protein
VRQANARAPLRTMKPIKALNQQLAASKSNHVSVASL